MNTLHLHGQDPRGILWAEWKSGPHFKNYDFYMKNKCRITWFSFNDSENLKFHFKIHFNLF